MLLEAGSYGKAAIDAVHVDIGDLEGLQQEAADAAASGFRATACIHPSQVSVVREAYRPDAETVAWARAVLEAAATERGSSGSTVAWWTSPCSGTRASWSPAPAEAASSTARQSAGASEHGRLFEQSQVPRCRDEAVRRAVAQHGALAGSVPPET